MRKIEHRVQFGVCVDSNRLSKLTNESACLVWKLDIHDGNRNGILVHAMCKTLGPECMHHEMNVSFIFTANEEDEHRVRYITSIFFETMRSSGYNSHHSCMERI